MRAAGGSRFARRWLQSATPATMAVTRLPPAAAAAAAANAATASTAGSRGAGFCASRPGCASRALHTHAASLYASAGAVSGAVRHAELRGGGVAAARRRRRCAAAAAAQAPQQPAQAPVEFEQVRPRVTSPQLIRRWQLSGARARGQRSFTLLTRGACRASCLPQTCVLLFGFDAEEVPIMREVVGGDAAVLLCEGAALGRPPEALIAAATAAGAAAAPAPVEAPVEPSADPPPPLNGRVVLLCGACREVRCRPSPAQP